MAHSIRVPGGATLCLGCFCVSRRGGDRVSEGSGTGVRARLQGDVVRRGPFCLKAR